MKKQIDAVQLMRDIRDKKRAAYEKDPALREQRLARIRKKYNLKSPQKTPSKFS